MISVSPITKIRSNIRQSRRGFTLIELMIVITIIAFLATIAITTYGFVFATTQEKATRATIKEITEILGKRRAAFNRAITKQDLEAGKGVPKYALNYMGAAGNNKELAKVMGKKSLFQKHFPQIYSESSEISSPGGTHTSVTESSELLYYMLTEGTSLGVKSVDNDAFTSEQIKDTDGDGRMEFVDAWGNPLRFYRWPTRLLRPAGTGSAVDLTQGATILNRALPAVTDADADDKFRVASSDTNFENSYHTPDTYHTPLIVSAGGDEVLGLYEPYDKTNFGHLAQPVSGQIDSLTDNITNLNTSGGGE